MVSSSQHSADVHSPHLDRRRTAATRDTLTVDRPTTRQPPPDKVSNNDTGRQQTGTGTPRHTGRRPGRWGRPTI